MNRGIQVFGVRELPHIVGALRQHDQVHTGGILDLVLDYISQISDELFILNLGYRKS